MQIDTPSYRISVRRHDGPYENFLYLITDKASGKSAAIDPAWDASWYLEQAREHGGELSAIWLTHSHGDHVNAVDALRAERPLALHISAAEAEFWRDTPADAQRFADGDTLSLGETRAKVLLTPGHTPGGSCFLLEQHLVAGDTLFVWGCGRCDFDGSSPEQMHASLARLATEVPGDTVILPGHDYGDRPTSTMAEQVAGNPFMLCQSAEEFRRYRMELHDSTRESPYRAMTREQLPL